MIKLLGIDNIFFEVKDLEKAIDFLQKLGFDLKFKIPHINAALLSIGNEEPGLIIIEKEKVLPSRFWVEVENAQELKKECKKLNINGKMLETATGFTFEINDPSGNIIGFADYKKKPELARK